MIQQKLVLGLLSLATLLVWGGSSPSAGCWEGTTIADSVLTTEMDCREVFPIDKVTVLSLAYSAVGWDLNPVEDPSRTVKITARPGKIEDGVFVPDGGADELEIMPETSGVAAFDWLVGGVKNKVYEFAHIVAVDDQVDEAERLYAYMDFTRCGGVETQDEFETAVLGTNSRSVTVVRSAVWPWYLINPDVPHSGVMAPSSLPDGVESSTIFRFKGSGRLHYEYSLNGGQMEVWADGESSVVHDEPSDWSLQTIGFAGVGAHEVVFACTRTGTPFVAGLRNVRWEADLAYDCADDFQVGKVDLCEGVRSAKTFDEILPFAYSSTNWIGDVVGAAPASVARVTVVKLVGTDSDVRNWTEEVPKTFQVLKRTSGEGEVVWRASRGVWKATFDILNGDNSIHQESVIFDLRATRRTDGLVIYLF